MPPASCCHRRPDEAWWPALLGASGRCRSPAIKLGKPSEGAGGAGCREHGSPGEDPCPAPRRSVPAPPSRPLRLSSPGHPHPAPEGAHSAQRHDQQRHHHVLHHGEHAPRAPCPSSDALGSPGAARLWTWLTHRAFLFCFVLGGRGSLSGIENLATTPPGNPPSRVLLARSTGDPRLRLERLLLAGPAL